ncbi:nucleotide pyrophosphohydrolase [Erysipelatoclostridium sp. An15]|uniref:nucleotide pyrophosphohydrolase n=1 Tax=Erysipelatoclostridium sp. An15 TaxID=1965566 RepID=UPI000B386709|nr:nucleotide pyrophosphohydrolase [Erysipelatoclostridium sp. An15]OUQ07012.1 nucleotide pyrophosphohydrolase [Erysipelatoclostridium sp. An15]
MFTVWRSVYEKAIKEIIKFNKERDWDQFHSPENLAKSIAIEAGELLECFQWDNNYNKEAVCEELADVVNYCILMADKLNVNLEEIVLNKLEKNRQKYPVEKSKGSSKKYNEL